MAVPNYPHVAVYDALPPPEALIDDKIVDLARDLLTWLRTDWQHLTIEDRIGITIWLVDAAIPEQCVGRSRTNTARFASTRMALAAISVAAAAQPLLWMGGILPERVDITATELLDRFWSWLQDWSRRWRDVDKQFRARMLLPGTSSREQCLLYFALMRCELAVGPLDDSLRTLRVAHHSARRRSGRRGKIRSPSDQELWGDFYEAAGGRDMLSLLLVRPDGRVAPSYRAVRDALRTPRDPSADPNLTSDVDPSQTCGPGSDDEWDAADAALDALVVVALVRGVAAERGAREPKGSARAVVLEHAIELLAGETTLVDLANQAGLSVSALSRAWTDERSNLLNNEALRRLRVSGE